MNRTLASIAIVALAAGAVWAQAFDHSHAAYDAVLKTRVKDGMVDYKALKADPEALDQYMDTLAAVSEAHFKAWTKPQQIAFLANLYNAATLRLILDHYPVKSIKDIGSIFNGPWDQQAVRLFGQTITLNTLEHGILRKQYNEPRIHMALVCAAKGCPPLRSEAYTPERLNEQLDDQARRYLASRAGLQIERANGESHLSSIFKWYGKDFVAKYTPPAGFDGLKGTERAVAYFCSRHVSAADRKYLAAGGYKLDYLDYDWSLNESQGAK